MDAGCFGGGSIGDVNRINRNTKSGKKINVPEERRTRDAISGDVYAANLVK